MTVKKTLNKDKALDPVGNHVSHTILPFCPPHARILILGTIPSPKSRAFGFYYGNPQNRFWSVLSDLLGETKPETNAEKMLFLERNHIALWDVLASCDIDGASDSSIKNPVANNFIDLLAKGTIRTVYTTGAKATALYKKLCYPLNGVPSVLLPSTSPANCRMPYETLKQAYEVILEPLGKK